MDLGGTGCGTPPFPGHLAGQGGPSAPGDQALQSQCSQKRAAGHMPPPPHHGPLGQGNPSHAKAQQRYPPGFHQPGGSETPAPPGVNPLPVLTWVLVLRKPNTAPVLLQSRAQHGGHTGDTQGDSAQLQDGGNTSLGSTGWGARGSAHTQGAGWRRWVHRAVGDSVQRTSRHRVKTTEPG